MRPSRKIDPRDFAGDFAQEEKVGNRTVSFVDNIVRAGWWSEGDDFIIVCDANQGKAGVSVKHIPAAGHIHTSITAVDALPTGAPIREQMADGLKGFFGATVPA